MALCRYVVPFLRYSASKNGVTLKLGLRVVQGHWKLCRSIDHRPKRLSIVRHCNYCCIYYNFPLIWRWIIITLKKSMKVIQTGTIRNLECGFLVFALHSNYGRQTAFHSTPPLRVSPSEYCHPVWYGKTRMVGLPDGEKNIEDMYNRLDSIPACDRRTDRQTDGHLATA